MKNRKIRHVFGKFSSKTASFLKNQNFTKTPKSRAVFAGKLPAKTSIFLEALKHQQKRPKKDNFLGKLALKVHFL
jgi:hypothetical protein